MNLSINENLGYRPLVFNILAGVFYILAILNTPYFLINYNYTIFIDNIILALSCNYIGYTRKLAIQNSTSREKQYILETAVLLFASLSSFIIYIIRAIYLTKFSGDILDCIIAFLFLIKFTITFYKIYNRRPQPSYNVLLITSASYNITRQQEQPEITGRLPDFVAKQLVEKAISENKTCPISLEPIVSKNSGVLNCGHVFCGTSLQAYLQTDNKCPICRKQPIVATYYIVEDNPV
jgi:hypothetical protein